MFVTSVRGEPYCARSKTWRDLIKGAAIAALTTASAYVVGSAKAGSPVRTGNLQRSIRSMGVRGTSVDIRANAPYARFVESGTKAHDIKPKNGRFLVFKMNGRTVSARKVRHPGTAANPFMGRARDDIADRLPKILARELRAVMQ